MPWKECSVMDERVRFVGRLLDGEKTVALCREFACRCVQYLLPKRRLDSPCLVDRGALRLSNHRLTTHT